jgi:pimeloyl-ACP methyl ester carboxylesterase
MPPRKITCAAALAFVCLATATGHAQEDTEALGIALENFDYPYPVSYFEFEAQGAQHKMAYMDIKPEGGNGRTFTLLHGKNFCGAYFEPLIRDLAEAGFRVVVPDQIGFGKSTKPEHYQFSFHALTKNTHALLESIGVSDTGVLGHSMGGMLAVRFALMYPDSTSQLVLVNPIGLEDWKRQVPYVSIDDWFAQELDKTEEGIRKYQRENYYSGEWKPEYDRWVEMLYRWTLSPEYRRIAWNAALTYDMVFTQPVVHEFGDLQPPTLLIIGQRDRTALGKNLVSEEVAKTLGDYPALGKAARDAIPNAELVELDDVGHLPHIEAYDRFWAALEPFLAR